MFTRSNCPPSNRRRRFYYLAIPAAIAILPFSDIPIAHAQSVMCFEQGGLDRRDAAFDASYQTRALAEKLAKDGDYVLVKDCTTEEQTQDWYIYSSSPVFQSGYKAQTHMDVTKGLDLRVSAAKGKNIFTDDNLNFNLFNYMTEVGHPKVFIIEGECDIPEGYFRDVTDPPLVIHLRPDHTLSDDNVKQGMDVISSLRDTPTQDIGVFCMISDDPSAMRPWQFDDFKAKLYAENAQKILSNLATWGAPAAKPASKEEFLNAVKNSSQSTIVLIGESSDGGKSIRIPGTNTVLTAEDLNGIPSSKRIIGLICGSKNTVSQYPGLSVIGTIFTDQSQTILRFALDRRPPATTAEFIDGGQNYYGKVTFTTAVAFTGTSALTLQLMEAPPPAPAVLADTRLSTSSATNAAPNSTALFGLGAFGAFLKEFFRWRTLAERKKTDLFLKPEFIFFSFIFIVSGAALGCIFGSWSASGPMGPGMAHIVAWVTGVGIEELVRRAAKLQIWTPSVAQGQLAEGTLPAPTQPSLLEFLRR